MKKWIIYIGILFMWLTYIWAISATEVSCPVKPKVYTPEVIRGKIELCLSKRKELQESSITDFYCPSGDYTYADWRVLNDNTIPYHIMIAQLLAQIDEDALKYMCTLRELREKDVTVWTEDLRKKFESSSEWENKSFYDRYAEVCTVKHIVEKMRLMDTPEKSWVTKIESFPQSICEGIVARKIQAWRNMGKILMNEGMGKSYQNDKDKFVDKVKGKYSVIIDKYIQYSRIAGRAISNLTALPKETIQWWN
jgi:hypothetical protein